METTNKLFYSGTKFFTENEEDYRITVRISLDDDCKNNICDWSITADVDWKNKHGKYEDYLGGCCHDEVAKHFPELAKFISLHLCNHCRSQKTVAGCVGNAPGRRVSARSGGGHHRSPVESKSVRKRFANRWMS